MKKQNDFNISERLGVAALLVLLILLFFRKKKQEPSLLTASQSPEIVDQDKSITKLLLLKIAQLHKIIEYNEEIIVTTNGQTVFTVPTIPTGTILLAYLGGVLLPKASYSVTDQNTITYLPANNENTDLEAGNRLNFKN